jgi:hypothetical protein
MAFLRAAWPLFVLAAASVLLDLIAPIALRVNGESLLAIALWLCCLRPGPVARALRWALAICSALLVLSIVHRGLFLRFMGDEPLLYDQLFMLRHLFVLIGDVWSWRIALGLAAGLLILSAALYAVRALLRVSAHGFATCAQPNSKTVAACLLAVVCLGSVGHSSGARVVSWVTPGLIENIAQSSRVYASVQHGLEC